MVSVKVNKLFRNARKKRSGDPDGIMAVLQITRRLLGESGDTAVYTAMDEAVELAAPKDSTRAWWGAHREIVAAMPPGYTTIGEFIAHKHTSHDEVLQVLDKACQELGRRNAEAKKGKWL